MSRARVAILVSGRGSNMAALIDAAAEPGYPAEIVAVVSNRPNAGALAVAERAGIATAVVDHRLFPSREAFDAELDRTLAGFSPDVVCFAGFMRLLTGVFIARWEGRMLNIHPALLPSFKGLDTHRRALETGVRLHGCTVHLVTEEMDAGPIVAQAAVPVLDGDDEESLGARVLTAEHLLYPRALALWASGRARLVDGKVVIDGLDEPPAPFIWP
ncbi:phosphoribosylglycinamide formyltransferase [Hansschlegelia beijingensis]|uniref:phosphoribosylglycinamide formyltransferase n=1 Tax=Hansschlegelia beijingensis TaxID=1133344 RepID=UPI00387EFAE8